MKRETGGHHGTIQLTDAAASAAPLSCSVAISTVMAAVISSEQACLLVLVRARRLCNTRCLVSASISCRRWMRALAGRGRGDGGLTLAWN